MVPLTDLWLPILLSAVFVFIVSSIVHMVLPHHRTDYAKVPREDDVMAALRPFNIAAGDYLMPRPDSPSAMSSPKPITAPLRGRSELKSRIDSSAVNCPRLSQRRPWNWALTWAPSIW